MTATQLQALHAEAQALSPDTYDCDFCQQPVDSNGYGYKLIGWNDHVLCADCEAAGKHL
jgi:hypothetical protein